MIRALAPIALLLAAPAAAQEAPPLTEAQIQDAISRAFASEVFGAYAHTLAAVALWGVLMMVGIVVAARYQSKSETETGLPKRDYANRGYRAHRQQQNMIETSGPFLAVALAAVLAGASPFWTNLLASLFVVARVGMLAVHVWTVNQPARSAFWLVGAACILGLAALALAGAFA